ncbi:MAG: phosphotransferase [Burkholderiales bacterium]
MQTEDYRLSLVQNWLTAHFAGKTFSLAPASADASFRRYFRATVEGETFIVMDAPPDKENSEPFVRIAQLFADAGAHVPRIIKQDLPRGLLLLSDFGKQTYLHVLNENNADELFRQAVDELIKIQLASKPGVLPEYDQALLMRELNLFPDWYVAKHLQNELSNEQKNVMQHAFKLIVDNNLAQPKVYVHRDFMPRNLMVSTPNPGVLDFQDAMYGPISYDITSLFKDAFISWDEARVLDWTVRYWEKARMAGLPVNADFGAFYRDCEWMGLQRHLKVLGIFARINYRDGKPLYLKDTPRFVIYVRKTCERYRELGPLLKLFDELEQRKTQIGYTF